MTSRKILLLSLIPIAIVSIYIFLFGLNIPFWDQWEVVHLLIKKQQGVLSFVDLFAPHNEHRPFFPRLIWLTLSGFTHYNVKIELWINLLIAAGTFVFVAGRSMKLWERLGISTSPLLIPLMSLLVFNLGQHESWLQGFQTVMFLGVACVIVGIFLLAEHISWRSFLVAILLGIIANYSMANGLLYWPVGLIMLFLTTPKHLRITRMGLWGLCGGICIVLFFSGWTADNHLNFNFAVSHILEWFVWILNFLGAPIMTLWYVAWIFGCISVSLYILIIGQVIRTGQWRSVLPYFGINVFILISALSISFGRMELGLPQSVVPRYLTISVWYWVSLLVLLPLLKMKRIYQSILYSLFTVSLILLMILGGWFGHVSLYQRILPAYQAARSGQSVSDDVLIRIHPDTNQTRLLLEFLRANQLSVYAERQ